MSRVLLVIPHDRFRDEEFKSVNEIVSSCGHEVTVGSSHHSEAQGHFGLLVKPDVNVAFVEQSDYDAIVFIGGRGVEEYFDDREVMNLILAFTERRKVVAALGMAVEILILSGILTSKKVTCDTGTIPKTKDVGAYYTGALVEEDGLIITGSGLNAREEFAKTVVSALEYGNRLRGYENARASRSRDYKN